MRNVVSPRREWFAFGLAVCLLLTACGRDDAPPIDHTAEYLQTAGEILSDALMGHFTNSAYETEWDLENAESTVDEERFPAWAQDRYDVCIHWTVPFSTEVFNYDRRPGNSSVFIQQSAEGWGWILISEHQTYIVELGYRLFLGDAEPVILVDLWDAPG